MTVEEKREALEKHCHSTDCCNCKLSGQKTCNCGFRCGKDITIAEIIGAYEIVFGDSGRGYTDTGLHIVVGDNCTINIYKKQD